MTKFAVIYSRFSSMEQRKGYSLERQKQYGRDYVDRQGWKLQKIITDEGRSAFHGMNRVEGASLHEFEVEARNGLHNGTVLCVENIDRLSRQGAKAAAQLIWSLNELGVDVATWHDGYIYQARNNGDMMELFSVIVKAQLAYEESLKKSQRTIASWKKRYEKIAGGEKTTRVGRIPSWIIETEKGYVLDERRAKVLNEIYDLYVDGVGIHKIIQVLNDREEPNWANRRQKSDGGWYLAYVHRLLTSRSVLGEYVTLKGDVVSLDFFPQAITPLKFSQAQAARAGRQRTGGRPNGKINNLLVGMVYCAACGFKAAYENKGHSTTRYVTKGGVEKHYPRKHYERLRCDRNRRKHGCQNKALFDYKLIEEVVLDHSLSPAIEAERKTPALIKGDEEIAECDRKIEYAQKKLENLVDAIADGGSKALVQRTIDLEYEIDVMKKERKQLEQRRSIELSKPSVAEGIAKIMRLRQDIKSRQPEIAYSSRVEIKKALHSIIERVIIYPDRTFTIATVSSVWHFDCNGNLASSSAV